MHNRTNRFRRLRPLIIIVPLCVLAAISAADEKQGDGGALFNGKDTSGWKTRHDVSHPVWAVVSEVKLDPRDKNKLMGLGSGGSEDAVLFRGSLEHGVDLLSEKEFGDCEVDLEFMVPEQSNSGVYLMGQYEVQILSETAHKKDSELNVGDCGAIYGIKPPSTQAETEPGTWQKLHVVFNAPRFDASGKKTQNARFVRVTLNSKTIQENTEAPQPTTSSLGPPERPTGPLLLQGDHGPVAFRHIRVTAARGQ